MTMMTKMLAAGAGVAAIVAAAPAAAQYGVPYGYGYAQSPYAQQRGYSAYGNPYAYNQTQMATQRCAAAVQSRLANRGQSGGLAGIVGAVLGVGQPMAAQGRVVQLTQVTPRSNTVRVRGLASSGRSMGYGPYGVGAYGAAGYAHQPDLSFKCDVDYRGRIRDIDINRIR